MPNADANIYTYADILKAVIKSGGLPAEKKKLMTGVIRSYFEGLREALIDGNEVKLPSRLGRIGVYKKAMSSSYWVVRRAPHSNSKRFGYVYYVHVCGGVVGRYRFKVVKSENFIKTIHYILNNTSQDYKIHEPEETCFTLGANI